MSWYLLTSLYESLTSLSDPFEATTVKWHLMPHKPLRSASLHHPSSSVPHPTIHPGHPSLQSSFLALMPPQSPPLSCATELRAMFPQPIQRAIIASRTLAPP